jgi:predicted amidohydrolase
MRLVLVEPKLNHTLDADNSGAVLEALETSSVTCEPSDVLVLPERFVLTTSRAVYLANVQKIATAVGCTVVGGSHHEQRGDAHVNAGVVIDGSGALIGSYEKVRPYSAERLVVRVGARGELLSIAGHTALVLICADFWYSDLIFSIPQAPDLVLVPALSVSRKPTPDFSRTLWRHLAVSRAYELGAYVGISDWAHDSSLPVLPASGVAGFADPTAIHADELFVPVAPSRARVFALDFEALARFRRDRQERGFFWKEC